MTPSEAGLNGSDEEGLRSPLAKRKKIAAIRSNSSRLKETISMSELHNGEHDNDSEGMENVGVALGGPEGAQAGDGDEDEEEEDEDEDLEDDFLAREMAEMEDDEDDGDLEEVG